MLRRIVPLVLPLVAACTPTRPATPKDPPSTVHELAPTPPVAEAVTPAPETASSPDLWHWDRGDGDWGDNLGKRTTVVAGDTTFTLGYLHPAPAGQHQSDERFGIIRTGSDGAAAWQAELGEHFVATGAMVRDGDTLYATHHCGISSGAKVSAVDSTTGQVRWTVDLQALGPVEHSKYRNETQIELDERGLVIYGNEVQGAYTEVLDPATGTQRSHSLPDPRFVALPWEGKGPEAPYDHVITPTELAVGDTHYVLAASEDHRAPTTLTRIDGHETVWTTSVRNESSCNRAAMRMVANQLWVAIYCPFSSGVELLAIDLDSGRRTQDARVRGLGPIAHSEYFNEVQLDELHGHVLVRGREAAGRYIEVIDPATGVSRVVLTFRD